MAITDKQKQQAECQQRAAAHDSAPVVRVVAGPGTGKSYTIQERVRFLLDSGTDPKDIYVVSFTRASCAELRARIVTYCESNGLATEVRSVHVSTMHSLALTILRRANLLQSYYPSNPMILDDWEQKRVYDQELSSVLGSTPTRASELRLAHDAQWQTLDPDFIAQAQITEDEKARFNGFHSTRTNLYSCVLPGEVIFKCVEAISLNVIQLSQLPKIAELIVDEYQDLNACDQEFVRLLKESKARLFIAGDDDQSIYSFRHAKPEGIIDLPKTYSGCKTHTLDECFRCTPQILQPASQLIGYNPVRLSKNLRSLYNRAEPSVSGSLRVWSFATADDEMKAIAESCKKLVEFGMSGQENEIVILLARRKPSSLQLEPITRELGNLGLPYSPPSDPDLAGTDAIRAVYAILRILKDFEENKHDYVSYRDLLEVMSGVGRKTGKDIADACINNNQNFRELFHLDACPRWLASRCASAVKRARSVVEEVRGWALSDSLQRRATDVTTVLSTRIFNSGAKAADQLGNWTALVSGLPEGMTFDELLEMLAATTEEDQEIILAHVNERLGLGISNPDRPKKIRILTMHGAKGLSGKVVFIPSAEQGIIPSGKAMQAAGLLIEQRRLFYVSMTRAKATCIISHAAAHGGTAAYALGQLATVRLPRSQFLNEAGCPSVNRDGGLTDADVKAIMTDVRNL